MRDGDARALWHRFETLHAVTYFADEAREANKAVGLRGFWMGYFGSRAAPLGPVPAAVVEALFFNFHPSMVARAIPDAWSFASPEAILRARADAAAAALRRAAPGIEAKAPAIGELLARVIEAAPTSGRAMFAANRALPPEDDPVARLWQATTCLREQRGDGHVALLAAEGFDGCEVHVMVAAAGVVPRATLADARGWSDAEWNDAAARLQERGLVDATGSITAAGKRARARIERATDRVAAAPFRAALDDRERATLFEGLDVLARRVKRSGIVPFPNPMGLPSRWTTHSLRPPPE